MNCEKCGKPVYHPNKLCPECEGKILDKLIEEQEENNKKVEDE